MKIPGAVFAVANAASDDHTRYAIAGVNLERSGERCRATATNGKLLIHVEWQDEIGNDKDGVANIAIADWRRAQGFLGKGMRVDFVGDDILVARPIKTGDVENKTGIGMGTASGAFPDYLAVLDHGRETTKLTFDSELLRSLLRAVDSFQCDSVTLEFDTEMPQAMPTYVYGKSEDLSFRAAIMPKAGSVGD